MRAKRFTLVLILALLTLPTTARADVLAPGQKPPRNEHSEAFVKCCADGITSWDRAYESALDGVEEIVLWRYPNSGVMTGVIPADWFRNSNLTMEDFFPTCYADGQGRFWGYVHYAYGRQMAWICLSDPVNKALPADPETVTAVEREVKAMLWRENAPAAALVVGITAATGVLLYVFWYGRKTGKRAP